MEMTLHNTDGVVVATFNDDDDQTLSIVFTARAFDMDRPAIQLDPADIPGLLCVCATVMCANDSNPFTILDYVASQEISFWNPKHRVDLKSEEGLVAISIEGSAELFQMRFTEYGVRTIVSQSEEPRLRLHRAQEEDLFCLFAQMLLERGVEHCAIERILKDREDEIDRPAREAHERRRRDRLQAEEYES